MSRYNKVFSINMTSETSLIESSLKDQKRCSCFSFSNKLSFSASTDMVLFVILLTKITIVGDKTKQSEVTGC